MVLLFAPALNLIHTFVEPSSNEVSSISNLSAQRPTDPLDRGLVAVKKQSGVFVSWRVLAHEDEGVRYNIYRNGAKLNATPLSVSNYTDASGTESSSYTVRAVVDGVLQAASKAATPWNTGRIDVSRKVLFPCPAYLPIAMQPIQDRKGKTVWSRTNGIVSFTENYTINDVSLGDLDGDGRIDLLVKRINQTDVVNGYLQANDSAYNLLEAYDMDGQRMWYIDCGPNMVSMNSTELNAVCYDWDLDGRAEVLLRGADNMIIHMADGTTYNVGNMTVNTRNQLTSHTNSQYEWTHTGAEYLLYLDGKTGKPYWVRDYPLPRLESGETSEKSAWGDDYGHRSSKYFMGAPFLDGRRPSIFLARGIYTRHKMVAYDVDPATHQLTERWRWSNNTAGSPWYGQGNHNYVIADVDGDGCDEIVYGSMVIDNNGRGLSTTGLGHGDAMHVGDLDPFRPGMEVFACNENKPSNNYRDATTSEIRYRDVGTSDDGRAMAGNFLADYPGCVGMSTKSGVISLTADKVISAVVNDWNNSTPYPAALNFRIYWDGDLLEESVNSPGTERECIVLKAGSGRIMQTGGVAMINDSKNNPCAQGDILGDWREELVLRSTDNGELRIYTTTDSTPFRLPSLWFDHAYRQAMVWQPLGYNQPPHASFFLGELEGITQAPPPLTMTSRTELAANTSVASTHNGKDLIFCGSGNLGIASAGASPRTLTINVPSTVAGADNNANISWRYGSCQLGATVNGTSMKGDLTGNMRLTKQGDGLLKLTARTFSYTGPTDVWAGSLYFRGTLAASPLWMNRHTTLYTAATYHRAVTLEYGATLCPSYSTTSTDEADYATVTLDTLNLHEGARIVFQLNGTERDALNIGQLNLRTRSWEYGPRYLAPVFEIQSTQSLADGMYPLGTLAKVGEGSLADIVVECDKLVNVDSPTRISSHSGNLYLVVGETDDEGLYVDKPFYDPVWTLDFEAPSANNYGFYIASGGVGSMAQDERTDGSHYFHIFLGNNNSRTVNRSFTGESLFAKACDYRLEFDLAVTSSNKEGSVITLAGSRGTLLTIGYGAWGADAIVADGSGTEVGRIAIHPYENPATLSATFQPSIFNHFILTANEEEGVHLSVTCDGQTIIDDVQLSPTFDTVASMSNLMGRYYTHLGIDDITLSYRCAGRGDVNCDGQVSLADITALVDRLRGRSVSPFSAIAADLDYDGQVTSADVVFLVNKVLGLKE